VAAAARPDARIVRAEGNAGFGPGCNLGWRASARPIVAFVNPDVRIRPGTFELLLERLEGSPHSMVGPAMLDEAGVARACKRRPSPLHDLLGLLPADSRWAPAGTNGRLPAGEPVHAEGGRVDAVEGACFLVRRSDLEQIGGFDEDFFLYYEEESLALRLGRLGGAAIYEPRAIAEHTGAASTRRVAALATRHYYRSRVIFYRKRDGLVLGTLAAWAQILAVLVSLPASALNVLLGRERPNPPGHQWQALRGLASGSFATVSSPVSYARRSG
jgi:GT2 family glycosyltransferase